MDFETDVKPNRSGNRLQDHLREALVRISSETDEGWVFERPVNLEKFPDYVDIIELPMHFSEMRKKIDSDQYTSLEEFRSDFDLVVGNCLKYFAEDTKFYKAAMKLKDEGSVIIKEVGERMDISNCIEEVLGNEMLIQPKPTSTLASSSTLDNEGHADEKPVNAAVILTDVSLREELVELTQKLEVANLKFSKANAMKLPMHCPERKAIKAEKMSLQSKIHHIERRLRQERMAVARMAKVDHWIDAETSVPGDVGGESSFSGNELANTSSKKEPLEEAVPSNHVPPCIQKTKTSWEQDFVAEVRKRPTLWDRRIAEYKVLPMRRALWREVGSMFQLMDAKEKWNLILNKFRGIHKRVQMQYPAIYDLESVSEERLDYLMRNLNGHRPWPIFKKMGFMIPFMPTYKTVNGEDHNTAPIDMNSLWDKVNAQMVGQDQKCVKRGQLEGEQSKTGGLKKLRRLDDPMSDGLDVHVSNDDVYGTFGVHVGDLASCVPQHLLPQCMRFVTSITYSFMDSKVPHVKF